MTAYPRNFARDAAETPNVSTCSNDAQFFAHVDDLERAGRAMIEAGRAQIEAGNAQLESCRALRALGRASAPADIASDLVAIASVAKMIGASKAAVRRKAWRKGVCVRIGGRLHVHRSAIGALYA